MATVIITLLDIDNGRIIIQTESAPRLPDDPKDATPAQKAAVMALGGLMEATEAMAAKNAAIDVAPPTDPESN